MSSRILSSLFFFNDTAPTEIYTLSLHDALPISARRAGRLRNLTERRAGFQCHGSRQRGGSPASDGFDHPHAHLAYDTDRKSTRLNSSHVKISYAVFCLKKKNQPERGSDDMCAIG